MIIIRHDADVCSTPKMMRMKSIIHVAKQFDNQEHKYVRIIDLHDMIHQRRTVGVYFKQTET